MGDSDDQDNLKLNRQQDQHPTSTSEPRVVHAECIDSINTKSGPNELREIAEKEGCDTTGMGQKELEQISRWVQSQEFQKEDEREKELREIAKKEGYDTTDMEQDNLEKTAQWIQSQELKKGEEVCKTAEKELRQTKYQENL